MSEPDLRWIVTIVYRGDLGLIDVEHHVEEIADVHDMIERGPDWNCLERVEIKLNPKRADNCTYEESLER